MADVVEIAIPTWNRADSVVVAVRSALAQGIDGMRVRVYDNGSTDDTVSRLAAEFGEQVEVFAWPENRGQAANIERIVSTDSDYLLILFDDEELMPGSVGALAEQLRSHPATALAYGLTTIRNWNHEVLKDATLFGVDPSDVPDVRSGLDHIRATYATGNHIWISSAMFALRRATGLTFTEKYSPQADSIMMLQAALGGDVRFVRRVVATRTDGLVAEGSATGQIVGVTEEGFDVPSVIGVLHYQLAFARFLHTECRNRFGWRERMRLVRSIERYTSGCAATAIAAHVARDPKSSTWRLVAEAAPWFRTPSSKLHLAIDTWRAVRREPTPGQG